MLHRQKTPLETSFLVCLEKELSVIEIECNKNYLPYFVYIIIYKHNCTFSYEHSRINRIDNRLLQNVFHILLLTNIQRNNIYFDIAKIREERG